MLCNDSSCKAAEVMVAHWDREGQRADYESTLGRETKKGRWGRKYEGAQGSVV